MKQYDIKARQTIINGKFSKEHKEKIAKSMTNNPNNYMFNRSGKDHPNYSQQEVLCSNCNTLLKRPKYRLTKQKYFFCNINCESEYKKNITGKKHFNWKDRTVKTICKVCGKKLLRRKLTIEQSKYKVSFCSQKCSGAWQSDNLVGSKVYNWTGGYDGYYGESWKKQRRLALMRDNYTCQECGKTRKQLNKCPDVHHIIFFRKFGLSRHEEANRLSNLISLCASCHSKKHNQKKEK